MTMAQRSELDYLIHNDPLGYADLILNGDPEKYLKNVAGSHGLEDKKKKKKQGASTGRVPIKQYLQKFPINGEDLA